MATHWTAYLGMLGMNCSQWARASDDAAALTSRLADADQVFLAISDDSLEGFHDEHLKYFAGPVYHFSGCHLSPTMRSCHPLMTFGTELHEPDVYRSLTLVLESEDADGPSLFSGFPNPVVSIPAQSKPLYHALCVMSCNFPQIIWKNTVARFKQLGVSADSLSPLLSVTLENSLNIPGGSVTGPLARNDALTIEKNIQSLHSDAEKELYRSFVRFMQLPDSRS
ncbi:DUF2520 domain-containing protein [Granulosicoccus sp. 3-233]